MSNPNEEETTTPTAIAQNHLKINNTTLTKAEQDALLRSVLPAVNGQEGSPANTFTPSELQDLQEAVGNISVGPARNGSNNHRRHRKSSSFSVNTIDIRDVQGSFHLEPTVTQAATKVATIAASPQGGTTSETCVYTACPQDGTCQETSEQRRPPALSSSAALDWHGAPRLHKDSHLSRAFREQVRYGHFTGPTNGICPGFLQCNLVVLPQGPVAFDFLLFCQRNPRACPLIDVCDVGSPFPHGVAPGADLRTDLPKYAIYRHGELEEEVADVTDYWPEQSVAFLIGCSFSYDGPLMDAGIPLKSAQQGKNVPMYKTALKCRPAGSLQGNMVVSMKPIPALQVSKHVEITSKYTHAHGGPVAVGSASAIGIHNVDAPEWGDPIDIAHDEIPIFHACGVTPQSILMESKVPFAITHSAGHMFVTDLPSDMGI